MSKLEVCLLFALFFAGYLCGAVMAVHFGELICG